MPHSFVPLGRQEHGVDHVVDIDRAQPADARSGQHQLTGAQLLRRADGPGQAMWPVDRGRLQHHDGRGVVRAGGEHGSFGGQFGVGVGPPRRLGGPALVELLVRQRVVDGEAAEHHQPPHAMLGAGCRQYLRGRHVGGFRIVAVGAMIDGFATGDGRRERRAVRQIDPAQFELEARSRAARDQSRSSARTGCCAEDQLLDQSTADEPGRTGDQCPPAHRLLSATGGSGNTHGRIHGRRTW